MHDLIGVIVECVTKVDQVVSDNKTHVPCEPREWAMMAEVVDGLIPDTWSLVDTGDVDTKWTARLRAITANLPTPGIRKKQSYLALEDLHKRCE